VPFINWFTAGPDSLLYSNQLLCFTGSQLNANGPFIFTIHLITIRWNIGANDITGCCYWLIPSSRLPCSVRTETVRAVSGSNPPTWHHLVGHLPASIRLTNQSHEVDQHSRHVVAPAVLARWVVTREGVVVVVKSLAHRADRYEHILWGVDVLVVRLVAP